MVLGGVLVKYKDGAVCEFCKVVLKEEEEGSIVVCPVCGAPYHKSCYSESGKCVYEEVHGTDKDYYNLKKSKTCTTAEKYKAYEAICCKYCFCENSRKDDFCKNCGGNLKKDKGDSKGFSFHIGSLGKEEFARRMLSKIKLMDGADLNEEIDGVLLKDLAKFTCINSAYYVDAFRRVRNERRGKFNFCAFWFPAAWFLYRKQYKIGTALLVISSFVSVMVTFVKSRYMLGVLKVLFGEGVSLNFNVRNYSEVLANLSRLTLLQKVILFVPSVCEILTIIVMFASGILANKLYLKHCVSKIESLKKLENFSNEDYGALLLKEGGVNTKALSLAFVCYLISQYLPGFFIK